MRETSIKRHDPCTTDSLFLCWDRLDEALLPFSPAMKVLISIPGIERRTAEVVIAEIGTDMSRFPSSRHLASWAGLCPGNNEPSAFEMTLRPKGVWIFSEVRKWPSTCSSVSNLE